MFSVSFHCTAGCWLLVHVHAVIFRISAFSSPELVLFRSLFANSHLNKTNLVISFPKVLKKMYIFQINYTVSDLVFNAFSDVS